jgi:hypothetical protein
MRTAMLLALSLAACLPLPPEHTYDDERQITVEWEIKGPDNTPGRCPSGFDTILVEACINEDLYACFQATTACDTSGSQGLTVYTSGRYRPDDEASFWDLSPQYWVYLSLTDPTGEKHSSSMPTRTDLSTGDKSVDATLYPEAGFLRLEWHLESAASGNTAMSCSELEIDEIELKYAKYTSSDPPLTESMKWPCTNRVSTDPDVNFLGDGDTPALAVGSYIGDAIAYRAGAEVGRYEEMTFTIEDRGEISESSVYIEITDR